VADAGRGGPAHNNSRRGPIGIVITGGPGAFNDRIYLRSAILRKLRQAARSARWHRLSSLCWTGTTATDGHRWTPMDDEAGGRGASADMG